MFLLVLGAGAVLATAVLLNAVFPLQGRLANLLALACLSFAQIVLLSEVLSEMHFIGRTGFLVGHLMLLALAFALWWRRGRPDLWASWRSAKADMSKGFRPHLPLLFFALVVLFVSFVNLGLALSTSPRYITWDPLSYHLPRAYFWAQNGTARHYYTEDIRQTEFPPNASFCYLWIMVLARSYAGLAVPSWIAGFVIAAGTAALARAAGHRRSAALFSGILFLTLPLPILHMVNEYSDLLTAAAGVCFVFFTLRALQRHAGSVPWQQNHEYLYAGAAFGLALGSKYSALFLLPGAGLAFLTYAALTLRRKAVKPLVVLAVSCIVGFALLGSYNYVLNVLDFGNPLTSVGDIEQATSDLARLAPSPELTYFPGNLARYVYQMMDWSLFAVPGNPIYRGQLLVAQAIDRALNLHMAAIPGIGWEALGFRQGHPNRTGFGPIAYVATVASPLLLAIFLLRARTSGRALLSGLYIVIAWGFLVTFAALAAWSIYKTHSFPVLVPMLLAGTMPWCYTRRRWAAVWLAPIMLVAVLTAMWVTAIGHVGALRLGNTSQVDPSDRLGGGTRRAQLDLLRDSLPPGSVVGFAGHRPTIFVFAEHLPEFKYVTVARGDIGTLLAENKVAAVLLSPSMEALTDALRERGEMEAFLVKACAECEPKLPSLPFLDHIHIRCLYVADPMSFLWDQRQHYGYDVVQTATGSALQFTGWRALTSLEKGWDYGSLTVALPTPGLLALHGNLRLTVRYTGDIASGDIRRVTYNGEPVAVRIEPGRLLIDLPPERLRRDEPLQLCTVAFADGIVVRLQGEGEATAPRVFAVRAIEVVETQR